MLFKKVFFLFVLIGSASFLLVGCGSPSTNQNTTIPSDNASAQPAEMYLGQQTNTADQKEKLCGWIDQSDIIIQLTFDQGVAKDTSYETGFYFSPVYSVMRLARSGCDYRVGFNFSEFKNKGAAEVGVRGYSDSVRRQLEGEPLSLVFDADGRPNIPLPITVKVKN